MKRTLTLTCAILTAVLMTGTVRADIVEVETSFQQGVSPDAGYDSGICTVGSGTNWHSANLDGDLRVGWCWSTFYAEAHIVFEFDLSEIAGRTVTDVELVLRTYYNAFGQGSSITVDLLALAEDFDETTVTWDSLTPDGGSLTGDLLSSKTFDPDPGWQNPDGVWDITFASSDNFVAAANAALAAGDNTLRFIARDPNVSAGTSVYAQFYNDEYGDDVDRRPELIVTSTPEPATMGLLGLGFAGMAALRRRRRK